MQGYFFLTKDRSSKLGIVLVLRPSFKGPGEGGGQKGKKGVKEK
jgi:hypothetical protein